jgi:hypothetical protein
MAASSKAAARREASKKPAEGTGEWGGTGASSSKGGNQAQSDLDGEGTVGGEGGEGDGVAGGKGGKWRRERRKAAAAAAAAASAVVDDKGPDGGDQH